MEPTKKGATGFKHAGGFSRAQREVLLEEVKNSVEGNEKGTEVSEVKADAACLGVKDGKVLSTGIYIKGLIGKTPVTFTADTGASRTVVSSRVYDQLSPEDKPVLKGSVKLQGAGGSPIRDRGIGIFSMTLGPVEVTKEAVVADIEDQVLLGLDVLAGGNGEQADIFLSKNVISLRGREIPLVQEGKRLRKVTVAEDVTVPALSEALVGIFVESQDSSFEQSTVVKPKRERHVVADFLVKLSNPFTIGKQNSNLTHHAEQTIERGNDAQIKQCSGRFSLGYVGKEKKGQGNLLQKNVIQESISLRASQIVPVKRNWELFNLSLIVMVLTVFLKMVVFLLFGSKMENTASGSADSTSQGAQKLQTQVLKAHGVARKVSISLRQLNSSSSRNKETYEVKLSFNKFKKGDIVWCIHDTRQVGVNPKFEKTHEGPFVIVEKRSNVNFIIQLNPEGQVRLVHHDKLKRYRGREKPKWIQSVLKS